MFCGSIISLNCSNLSHIWNCFQFPGGGEEAYFEGAPYEWWVEGGKKTIEAGQLVGVVRAVNLQSDKTVYGLKHNYNGDGEEAELTEVCRYNLLSNHLQFPLKSINQQGS